MTRTMNGLNVIFQTLSLLLMCWICNKLSFVDSEVVFEGNNLMRHYVGCFSNLENGLNSFLKSSKNIKECLTHCSESDSYTFAALKNGSECYCVNEFSQSAPDAECEVPCKSSRRVPCGGRSAYSIYTVCVVGNYGKDCNISCTSCRNSIPCKRNTGECIDECYKNSDDDDKCDLSNRLIDVNVAFNQDAEQSSTYRFHKYIYFPAALAVDGNFDNNFQETLTCTHTECSYNNSWLSVDLIERRHVKEVVVTNRQDFGHQIRYFQVYLSENTPSGVSLQELKNYHLCNSYPNETSGIKTLNMTCNDDAIGRYLIVVLPRVGCLSICELEVYLHDCYNCKENETCSEEVFDSHRRRCICKTGFSKETITSNCLDINECLKANPCSENAECINNAGSFSCECNKGYIRDVKNVCQDIDECLNKNICSKNARCTNTDGSFSCKCNDGYFGNPKIENGCRDVQNLSFAITGLSVGLSLFAILFILSAAGAIHFYFKFKKEKLQNYIKINGCEKKILQMEEKSKISKNVIDEHEYDEVKL